MQRHSVLKMLKLHCGEWHRCNSTKLQAVMKWLEPWNNSCCFSVGSTIVIIVNWKIFSFDDPSSDGSSTFAQLRRKHPNGYNNNGAPYTHPSPKKTFVDPDRSTNPITNYRLCCVISGPIRPATPYRIIQSAVLPQCTEQTDRQMVGENVRWL